MTTIKTLKVRGTVAFDFDGVLSEGAGYHWPLTSLDLTIMRKAQDRGYAVAVVTCNTIELVAGALREQGFKVLADTRMTRQDWLHPSTVLVTNRKISATMYVDDRAVNYRYGQPASVVLDALDVAEGFCPCPLGRHWGPYGAAGVVPFTVFRDRLYLLLGLRSRNVQTGGTWAGFGGALDFAHEDTWAAARRELGEEVAGLDGDLAGPDWADYIVHDCPAGCGWRYVTFLAEVWATGPDEGPSQLPRARVGDRFETDKVAWVRLEDVASYRLHPGFAEQWPSLRRSLVRYCRLELAA